MKLPSILLAVVTVAPYSTFAESPGDDVPSVDTDRVRAAITRAIPLLEAGSAGSADNRKCFTCHNQALPILALAEAKRHGFDIDEDNLTRQLRHTQEHLNRGRKNYDTGKGQGGRVITAGYALWALDAGGVASDDTTTSVTGYLLRYQNDRNRWSHPGQRPPSSGSDFTTTYFALRGLADYATDEQAKAVESRIATVRPWLLETSPKDTEDRVFQLRSLSYIDADTETIEAAKAELMDQQRADGGWSQNLELSSDAYATATVLVGLLREGDVASDDDVIKRGIQYLLDSQQDDGSWHVVTRAKAFQTYFESGFPHGKDQFISIAASSWATTALLLTLPDETDRQSTNYPGA